MEQGAKLIDGKAIAADVTNSIKEQVAAAKVAWKASIARKYLIKN